MDNSRYGVLVIMYEFLISAIVLLGGGALLFINKSPEANAVAISAITAAITFWFSRRQTDSNALNNQQINQQAYTQPTIPIAAPIPTPIQVTENPPTPKPNPPQQMP